MSKKRTVNFVCVTMVLLFLLLFNQVMFAETNLTTGLVAYCPFNGNANDESGRGNHGVVSGATLTADRFGNPNRAYSFDGVNDYINLGNSSDFTFNKTITFSAWVKPFGTGTAYILNKWVCYYEDKFLAYSGSLALFYLYRAFNLEDTLNTQRIINLNKWTHIVATYNGSIAKVYIDGILNVYKYASSSIANSNGNMYIGFNPVRNVPYLPGFYGHIDDVRIYNRALSDSEVQSLYHEGGWPTPNLLQNPSFDTGIENWYCVNNAATTAQANLSWDTAEYNSAPGSLKVQCYNKGNSYTDIQLLTHRVNLIKDRTYLLTFKAKSNAGFTIPSIKINQAVSPWTDYAAPYTGLTINTGWQNYSVIFTATATASDARVTFFLGGALPDGAVFNLDDVSLKEFVVNPLPTGELLPNPEFDLGKIGWNLSCDSTAKVSGYLDSSDFNTAPVSFRIECTQSGSSVNGVQLFTMPFNLAANQKYQLTFRAKCSNPFIIPSIRLMKATSPWTIYAWPLGMVSITTEWQTYTVNFTAYSTASDGRLTFFLGNALPPGTVFWIDSVSLQEVAQ